MNMLLLAENEQPDAIRRTRFSTTLRTTLARPVLWYRPVKRRLVTMQIFIRVFSASSTEDVAKLLHVSPGDIIHLVSRLPKQYVQRTRRKPDGTKRKLLVPSDTLMVLQRKINDDILSRVPLLPCVYGGVREKSVIHNARIHVGQQVVFAMDIEQCFPSIVPAMVRGILKDWALGRTLAAC
jgi:hypothetical protein